MRRTFTLKEFKRSEKDITHEIRSYLKIRGIFHWKQFQGLGAVRGIPDIIGIWKGRMLCIEVKTETGKIRPEQQAFIDRINADKGLAFIARSVEDVMKELG